MLQNLKNLKILFKNYGMRNFRIFRIHDYMRNSERRCKLSEYF